jgi:hypothetical protein
VNLNFQFQNTLLPVNTRVARAQQFPPSRDLSLSVLLPRSADPTHASLSAAPAVVFVFLTLLPLPSPTLPQLRSAAVSRSLDLKRPVSRPPSADADHLDGIYPGAVFLLASSRGAAWRPESLGGLAVCGLVSSFVGKEARMDRPDGGLFYE